MSESFAHVLEFVTNNFDSVKPLGNYLTIKKFEPPKKSVGGIVLPESLTQQSDQMLALVIEVGKGATGLDGNRVAMQVAKGDLVLIMKHAPVEIKIFGDKVNYAIQEGDVIGVVDRQRLKASLSEEVFASLDDELQAALSLPTVPPVTECTAQSLGEFAERTCDLPSVHSDDKKNPEKEKKALLSDVRYFAHHHATLDKELGKRADEVEAASRADDTRDNVNRFREKMTRLEALGAATSPEYAYLKTYVEKHSSD